jgi:hypothetical protein
MLLAKDDKGGHGLMADCLAHCSPEEQRGKPYVSNW